MANWLNKYEQGGLVLKKKTKDNFNLKFNPNDVKASVGPGFVGAGYDTTGRNYSPAWGGQFAVGGSIPGTVGFTYARVAGSAPANGKYTKKTKASAQNGMEMKYYQDGLDFKPKTISKNGSVIKDDMGQWAHPGEITEINSNEITMQGVPYDVLGISDLGDTKLMKPGKNYKFKGKKVTEYPQAEFGDYFQDSGQASIGKGVGTAIGSAFFGPLGGQVGGFLGKVAGNLLGGAADANKLAGLQDQNQQNLERSAWAQGAKSIHSQYSSNMKHGGWLDKYK